ncbi:hypothetical protein OAU92_03460 [Acidimicrobiia bacterium]|nr:hypothetical protein [Acidimicrobiia bacterium]
MKLLIIFSTSFLFGEFNFEFLDFYYFFSNDDCVMRTDYQFYNGMVAGYKLVNYIDK